MGKTVYGIPTTPRVWLDAITYAVVLAVAVTGGSFAVGIAAGGGLPLGNVVTFVVGWLLVGYGTIRLWPSNPDELTQGGVITPDQQSRLQGLVRQLPPVRWYQPAPRDQLRVAAKIFWAGVVTLAFSYIIETALNVG